MADPSTKPPRRQSQKDRDTNPHRDPQPTDFDERMTALKRRTAGAIRPRERAPQPASSASPPPPPPPPSARSPRPLPAAPAAPLRSPRRHHTPADADHDDFSRRLMISSPSPAPPTRLAKLFNPSTDPIPVRRTAEPEAMSDATGSSHAHARPPPPRDAARQLFDPRKDDPVRFSVLARPRDRPVPTPKSSGDYVSASSTSSYTGSAASSVFTLSSTTDGSSASSAVFDRAGVERGEGKSNVFTQHLKVLYREVVRLEKKIGREDNEVYDADDVPLGGVGRVKIKGKETVDIVTSSVEELEREKWRTRIADHKKFAEDMHELLRISLAPSAPATLHAMPDNYSYVPRLWTSGFHKLLEDLRYASFASTLALEHLQDFTYYAYAFYTGILEEPTLSAYKSNWLEALGDLARYRMAVAAIFGDGTPNSNGTTMKALTVKAVHDAVTTQDGEKSIGEKSVSNEAAARIDDSPSPSVGIAAARLLEVESETERWRGIAKHWYGIGLSDRPGTGKFHHHLGGLCRDVEGENLRGVYHFVKSMTARQSFSASREAVLSIWSAAAQARHSKPDAARAPDLFVLLQGMLFTHIQLDDFQPTLAQFIERLEIEGAEEREWIMMAVINIGSLLEYGRPNGILRRVGSKEGAASASTEIPEIKVVVSKKKTEADDRMDVDERPGVVLNAHSTKQMSPPASEAEDAQQQQQPEPEYPQTFKCALQLAFAMLEHVLGRPTRKASAYAQPTLNPYLSVVLTFLATALKHPQALAAVERSVPWEALAAFFARVPRSVMASQGLFGGAAAAKDVKEGGGERWVMLTSGCAPPLPEDWCLRGMEWVSRKVFERGYWKSGEDRKTEIEVLEQLEGDEITDGTIENDDANEEGSAEDLYKKRWVRIVRSGVGVSTAVDGFTWVEGTREWRVEGKLAEKVRKWREQDQIEREAEERRRLGTRWADDSMDIDGEEGSDVLSEEDDDDENDTDEIKALKARRRYLQNLLQSAEHKTPTSSSPPHRPRPRGRRQADSRPPLPIAPGYTILVVDTNILLSSLSMFASVVESLRWTVIVPLPVIMELDGLSGNEAPQLSEAAQSAMEYISSHVRSHTVSLKVQTSKGNYLSTLSVRTEQVDFEGGNWERNMDDLILKAAIWQDEHWVDRSAMLKPNSDKDVATAVKVVLLSLDRNLRLKARARQLPAASEKDLASILANAT